MICFKHQTRDSRICFKLCRPHHQLVQGGRLAIRVIKGHILRANAINCRFLHLKWRSHLHEIDLLKLYLKLHLWQIIRSKFIVEMMNFPVLLYHLPTKNLISQLKRHLANWVNTWPALCRRKRRRCSTKLKRKYLRDLCWWTTKIMG